MDLVVFQKTKPTKSTLQARIGQGWRSQSPSLTKQETVAGCPRLQHRHPMPATEPSDWRTNFRDDERPGALVQPALDKCPQHAVRFRMRGRGKIHKCACRCRTNFDTAG